MTKKKKPQRSAQALSVQKQRCMHAEVSVSDAAAALAKALFLRAHCRWDERKYRQEQVEDALQEIYQKSLSEIKKIDEFLKMKPLNEALVLIFSENEARQLQNLFSLRFRGITAETVFRRAFHSSVAGDYIRGIFLPAIYRRICACGYSLSVMDCLSEEELEVPPEFDLANRLALALSQQEESVCAAVKAIVCEADSKVALSKEIIQGIIRSGHQPSIALLKQRFLSEETPQKLRLSILEAADEGSIETLVQFMELIASEGLYRLGSVASALSGFLGIHCDGLPPDARLTCLRLSLNALAKPERCGDCMQSENILTAYFALWSKAVRDISGVPAVLKALLQSPEKEKKLLCLYFINDVMYDRLPFAMAVPLFASKDLELLAWLLPNLLPHSLSEYGLFQAAELPAKPQKDLRLPASEAMRRQQFAILNEAVVRIGNGERHFPGSLFPWLDRVLSAAPLINCMMNLALYDLNADMVSALGKLFVLFGAEQRGKYYAYLTDPERRPEDRRFLLQHLTDRSPANKEIILRKLSGCHLSEDEIPLLLAQLSGKRESLRRHIVCLLSSQPHPLLSHSLSKLLSGTCEEQLQAALTLMFQLKRSCPLLYQAHLPQVQALAERHLSLKTQLLLQPLLSVPKSSAAARNAALFEKEPVFEKRSILP